MQHTAIKQIKYNRGQVTDKLSERSDMGLQNACGVVYNNVYINRYGQLQKAPSFRFAEKYNFLSSEVGINLIVLFDTGTDKVIPISISTSYVKIYAPLSKQNRYQQTDFSTATQTVALSSSLSVVPEKAYQFGSNIVVYGQNTKPFLVNIVPLVSDWSYYTLSVKENYFDGSFNNVFVRGLNTDVPSDFTVPTTSYYKIANQTGVTTSHLVKVLRNGAGGAFTQSLVGQVIKSTANGGVLQVRSVEDGDTLWAFVLSPMSVLNASDSEIQIPWNVAQTRAPTLAVPYQYDSAEWVFGYENPFSDVNGYPDSVTYVNQRLIFGGNDRTGNLVLASRIGVINDFDPDGTEADSFSASIAAPQNCRVVDFVQSNDELRIATTYGEYAVPLSALTPSGIIQSGFQLRSQVGVKKDTPICDCGGLTAYVSSDGNSVHCTQFALLQNKYSPISLTSQTENIIRHCSQLVYLRNRDNDEGNCLVGLNEDGTMFVGNIDTNAGLNGFTGIDFGALSCVFDNTSYSAKFIKLLPVGAALWGIMEFYEESTISPLPRGAYLVRFSLNDQFVLPFGFGYIDGQGVAHESPIVVPLELGRFIFGTEKNIEFRALYNDNGEYRFISPVSYTVDSFNQTMTLVFDDEIDQTKIISAGFVPQCDWRSVELSVGLGTRELNKRIIKLSSVVEPVEFRGEGINVNNTYKIPESDIYKFFNLVLGDSAPKLTAQEIDNPVKTIFTEGEDMSWRRAFDNPSRELHYGFTLLAPFLVKSTTAVLEYDEVA